MVLHGCAHNPTGMDPTHDQWKQIAEVLKACVVEHISKWFFDYFSVSCSKKSEKSEMSQSYVYFFSFRKNSFFHFSILPIKVSQLVIWMRTPGLCDTLLSKDWRSFAHSHSRRILAFIVNPFVIIGYMITWDFSTIKNVSEILNIYDFLFISIFFTNSG